MTDYNLPKNTNRHDSVPVLNPTEQKPCQPPTCDGNNDAPNDAQSSADRMQLVVETLTSDYYGDSILVDYAMAHRVIAYCRRVADGRREDNRAGGPFHEMMTFLHRHNQSAGWVMGGDMKFMILQSANGTSARQPPKLRLVSASRPANEFNAALLPR